MHLVLEGVVEQQDLALGPPARLAAHDDLAVALGHHEPQVRTQPRVRRPAVRGEARVRPQQGEVSRAERAGGAVASELSVGAAQQGTRQRRARRVRVVTHPVVVQPHVAPVARLERLRAMRAEEPLPCVVLEQRERLPCGKLRLGLGLELGLGLGLRLGLGLGLG